MEEPYEHLPQSQIYLYDHYGTNGKYGAVQTSRVILQMKALKDDPEDDDECYKIKLKSIRCNNKYRGLSMYNPSTKHLAMSNCLKNQNEFKKLSSVWDRISRMLSIQNYSGGMVKEFMELSKDLLRLNNQKICLLSGSKKLNHRVRFEFYCHSALKHSNNSDLSTFFEENSIPELDLNHLLVSVDRSDFAEYQLNQITLVTEPIKNMITHCYELDDDGLKNFFTKSLEPEHFATMAFCLERSVEMMNLIGFSGRITSSLNKKMRESPLEDCLPWTRFPKKCFKEYKKSALTFVPDLSLFIAR